MYAGTGTPKGWRWRAVTAGGAESFLADRQPRRPKFSSETKGRPFGRGDLCSSNGGAPSRTSGVFVL